MAPVESGFPPLDLMLPQVERLPLSNGQEYSLHAELRLELLADAVLAAYAGGAKSHPISLLAATGTERARRPFFILAVSAGDSIRRWTPEKFVELAQKLIDEFAWDVCVVGGWAERPLVEVILADLPAARAVACVDLPLIDLAARVAQASLLVGLGSGVTHLAATLGVPTVSILSGVSPLDVWRPVGPRVVNLTGETPCSPCGLKHERDCPFAVACLRSITAEHVLAAADRLLQGPHSWRRYSEHPSAGDRDLTQQGERNA
jgi:ADP-heptose:LPS heptosyltransferase